jgi:hypothetical protein
MKPVTPTWKASVARPLALFGVALAVAVFASGCGNGGAGLAGNASEAEGISSVETLPSPLPQETPQGPLHKKATPAESTAAADASPASGTADVVAADHAPDASAGAPAVVQTGGAKPDAPAADSAGPPSDAASKPREFKKEGPDGALRVTYDDLDVEKLLGVKKVSANVVEQLPGWLQELRGKRVRLRGFMLPTSVFQQTGNSFFVLTRDTGACCFGPNPTVYYLVMVKMKPGATTDFIDNRPFDVVGTFDIKLMRLEETGEDLELYHLSDAVVIPK